LFYVTVPFGLLFVVGDFVATPLEKHRHSSVTLWLCWTFVRLSIPLMLVAAGVLLLAKALR